ncbi:MAG: NAD-dependent protein deacetylase [Alkalispirochaeta sp.]
MDGAHSTTAPALDDLLRIVRGRSICVLTGAGISTDSGIPDYRGPDGSLRKRLPIQYHEFLRSREHRRRYWARSCLGWSFLEERTPNVGHLAIADLQDRGVITGLITQNVDGLHQAAGSRDVTELHGGLSRVRCMQCGDITSRSEVQRRLLELNPGWLEHTVEYAPDGDAELPPEATDHFAVPVCDRCEGTLKPDVVFFGESVPAERVAESFRRVADAEILLVLGSSLTVYSGFRFADYAVKHGKPLVIINLGTTRADSIASIRINAPIASVLPVLRREL